MTPDEGLRIAKERIALEAKMVTGTLDLGGLMLPSIPPEIGELRHLEVLNLSVVPIDQTDDIEAIFDGSIAEEHLDRIDVKLLGKLSNLRVLVLAGSRIRDLEFASMCGSLQSLNCWGTQVSDLSPLSGLASLQSLDCSRSTVSDLGPLSDLASLQSLNCWGTQVSDLGPLSGLASLQSLNCLGTQVSDLGPLSGLASLQSLNCAHSPVSDLSPLSGLASLQSLDCSGTQVSDLGLLSGLVSLQSLNCWGTHVSDLGPLSGLASLQSLNCAHSPVSDLGPLSGLASLQSLDCSRSTVSDLGPLSDLASLQSLNCWGTQVSDLGPLSGLASLQSLNCWGTQVSDLGPLSGLASLQTLYCSDTPVSDLGPLSGLASLQTLYCSDTPVSDLGPLSGLASLHSFYCSGTPVSDLGPLSGLASLQTLYCSDTPVSDLGPLSGLASLQSLDCSGTLVSDLGPLSGLASLQSLSLGSCPIESIPACLLFGENLRELFLWEVSRLGYPAEVLSQDPYTNCLRTLRSHVKDLAAGAEALPDVKIVVVGNGRIGKTQICRRLRGEGYESDADSTHGITISDAPLEVGTDKALAHLWDFGGQDIYHGTHALFMRTRAMFLCVWTPSSDDRGEHEHQGIRFRNHRLDYWLQMIRSLGGKGSPLLVVQNQCDTVTEEMRRPPVPDELLDYFEFCKLLHYSAKEDRGRAALNEAIADAVRWIWDCQGRAEIGIGRMKVLRRLEALRQEDAGLPSAVRKHRILSRETFIALCYEAGNVSDPDHFLSYLHECGVVYHRAGLLDGTIILDQEWALEAIYTIFNREKCWKQLRQLRGRFTRSLLETLVWSAYDSKEQELFLDLMRQAGICFVHREQDKMRGIETEYVAPDLLPGEGEIAEELQAYWKDLPCEERDIDFPFEFPGLLRNVIAKVGQNAGANAVYWKNGVCAYDRHSGSYARIEGFSSETENDYSTRLRIRTQQGRAEDLLHNLVKWVADEVKKCGCKDVIAAEEDPLEPHPEIDRLRKGRAAGVPEERFQPAFDVPPRSAATTYCVSYAWTEESSETVDRICADALSRGIEIIRDKTHLGLGERISTFMQRLAKGDRVFVILSEKYLQSPYCMFELFEIWRQSKQENEEFLKRIRVYRLPDAKIGTIVERARVGIYWKQQFEEIDALIREHGGGIIGGEDFKRYNLMRDFAFHAGEILNVVMDTLQPTSIDQLEDFGFAND